MVAHGPAVWLKGTRERACALAVLAGIAEEHIHHAMRMCKAARLIDLSREARWVDGQRSPVLLRREWPLRFKSQNPVQGTSLGQFDVAQQRVLGAADLVLDQAAARGAEKLAELDSGVDEALRVADQRVGGLDGPVDAERVRLVV